MRRFDRFSVGSWCTKGPCDPSRDPVHQFAQYNRATTAKDDYRPCLPDQSLDKLVNLRIRHIDTCCEFRATRVRLYVISAVHLPIGQSLPEAERK